MADNIDTLYADIGIVENGRLELVKGLSRGLIKRDYFPTQHILEDSDLTKLDIRKVFSTDGNEVSLSSLLDDRSNLKYQFKFITEARTQQRALQITDGSTTVTPNDYINGVVSGGQFFRNALFTDSGGNILDSKFFDGYLIKFRVVQDIKVWVETSTPTYPNAKGDIVGGDLYTVFTYFEGKESRDLATLIHLSDPAFRPSTDSLHYQIKELGYQFKSHLRNERQQKDFEKLTADPFSGEESYYSDLIYAYAKFTPKVFMEIFNLLTNTIDKSQAFAMNYLDILNGISSGVGFKVFRKGPGIKDINNALNDLQFTEEEFYKFIYKKYNPITKTWSYRFRDNNGKFYIKSWLKLVYDKIMAYTLNDNSVYARQKTTLEKMGCKKDMNPFSQRTPTLSNLLLKKPGWQLRFSTRLVKFSGISHFLFNFFFLPYTYQNYI